MRRLFGAVLASASNLLGVGTSMLGTTLEMPPSHRYRLMKPVTTKNIGRNYMKGVSKYKPHQGERECARRRAKMVEA